MIILRAQHSGVRISTAAKCFSLLQKCPDQLWVPQSTLRNRYPVYFPSVKRPVYEVNHLLPYSVEVRTSGAIPPLHLYAFIAACLLSRKMRWVGNKVDSVVHGGDWKCVDTATHSTRDRGQVGSVTLLNRLRDERSVNQGLIADIVLFSEVPI
jgi:hypothetical protein